LFAHSGKHRMGNNFVLRETVTRENIETRWLLNKLHERAVKVVDTHLVLRSGIHGDTADSTDVGERKDIRNRLGVIPHLTQIGKITDHVGVLMAAVGDRTENVRAAADVNISRFLKTEMVD
jgi:hypothetical protein